ncbi:MAG: hypothetical protein S4CHLAM6_07680 [Chlamydiae bacterium]|nr:hypothetical protein [Chlamydiota bacterium]
MPSTDPSLSSNEDGFGAWQYIQKWADEVTSLPQESSSQGGAEEAEEAAEGFGPWVTATATRPVKNAVEHLSQLTGGIYKQVDLERIAHAVEKLQQTVSKLVGKNDDRRAMQSQCADSSRTQLWNRASYWKLSAAGAVGLAISNLFYSFASWAFSSPEEKPVGAPQIEALPSIKSSKIDVSVRREPKTNQELIDARVKGKDNLLE